MENDKIEEILIAALSLMQMEQRKDKNNMCNEWTKKEVQQVRSMVRNHFKVQ
jgi:hypothetical protein